MQTFLKVFGGLILLFIVGGLILDNNVNVTRSIEIDASPQEIHAHLNDLEQWPAWSPWHALDPSMKTTLGEITKGVGASQTWTGESGSGGLTFIQSSASEGIAYNMTFEGDSTEYVAGFRYARAGQKTQVTWYMQGKMQPIIIGNYFAQLMDALVGDSFNQGLQQLKRVVEKRG
ncbi:SRPBCC family protein [Aliikangiella sp. IMCC44632]